VSDTPSGGHVRPRAHGDDIPVFMGLVTCPVEGCDWSVWEDPESPVVPLELHRIEAHHEGET
jgi:hypothetical protein